MASLTLLHPFFNPVEACTRILYQGIEETVITGRSMDWREDMHSNIWVFPRGIKRNGAVDRNPIAWTSKYGSVTVSGYDVGTADGMNEKGFVANLLYLDESDYGKPDGSKPLLSISLWAQYALDNFETVAEAVEHLRQEPFQIVTSTLPNGSLAQLHLSISDSSGDSAVFEYLNGKLVIHHGKQYKVMTNSPSYDQQLALNAYWQDIGGTTFLPGTNRAADRFVRASFFLEAVPKKADPRYISAVPDQRYAYQAVAEVMSIMRSVSIPLGITTPDKPNIAATLWRTISDQKNKVYYFDSATSPNAFWISLSDLNFKEDASIMKLEIAGGKIYAGNASGNLKPAKPFTFLPAKL
nr:linear amide C-N hydrolase [Candidatus Protochlamydia phocaeensis]